MNRHYIRFPTNAILLDRILPDQELQTSLTMKLGEYWIPIIGVNDFPEETYPAILDDINRLRLEYRWMVRYICLDKEAGKKEAQKKEKAHRGSKKTFLKTFFDSVSETESSSGDDNHGASVKELDSITAGVEIDTDEAALGYYTTCVMVWSKDFDTAKEYAEEVKAVINRNGFTCKDEDFNALEAFKSMMPGQIYANYRALPVMTNTLAHVVPLSSVWAGMRRNEHAGVVSGVDLPHLVCSTAEGTPFFFNLNPSDVGHAAILGPTGAGKSTLLGLLIIQFFKYPGSHVIVFDKGRSCRQSCLASGGLYYEPASESSSGVALSPLRDLETERDMLDAIDFIESLFTVNEKTVSPLMRAAIKEVLEQLKTVPKTSRTLTDFIHYCQYQDEKKRPLFKESLQDYLIDGGKYGKIFDQKVADISLDRRFIAFEMETLMNQGAGCVVPALLYLFNLVEKMFDGRLTLLVLDEAWLFLKNEIFSQKIAEWLKVLRKKNVFVVFATQDVADVEQSPLRTTIVQQCLTKIFLADPNAGNDVMAPVYSAFGLTPTEIGLIASSIMKRDYFYTSPLGRRSFQLDLGKVTLGLIGAADHVLLDKMTKGKEAGSSFCAQILDSKRISYSHLLGEDAPVEPPARPKLPTETAAVSSTATVTGHTRLQTQAQEPGAVKTGDGIPNAAVAQMFNALRAFPKERGKNGSRRRMIVIAERLNVSLSLLYQAKKVLACAPEQVIQAVEQGQVSIKTAYKRLDKEAQTTEADN